MTFQSKVQGTLERRIKTFERSYEIRLTLGEKIFLRKRIEFWHRNNEFAQTTRGSVDPSIEATYDLMREYGVDPAIMKHPRYLNTEAHQQIKDYFREQRDECVLL
jgi:hypothetical protein